MEARLSVRQVTREAAGRALAGLACYTSGELDGAQIFAVDSDGGEVGCYAVKIIGQTGWLLAGAGALAGHDLTAELLPAIEHQFRLSGCVQIMIRTARPGLLKKLDGAGYALDSAILGKPL